MSKIAAFVEAVYQCELRELDYFSTIEALDELDDDDKDTTHLEAINLGLLKENEIATTPYGKMLVNESLAFSVVDAARNYMSYGANTLMKAQVIEAIASSDLMFATELVIGMLSGGEEDMVFAAAASIVLTSYLESFSGLDLVIFGEMVNTFCNEVRIAQ